MVRAVLTPSIVVADAGPLHYLVLIDCGEILGKLFDLPPAIGKLKQTSFFISQEILEAASERDNERQEKKSDRI